MPIALAHVCFEGEERKWRGLAAMSQFDPLLTCGLKKLLLCKMRF
jgi:hypothetical protein